MLSLKNVLMFCFTEGMIEKVKQINDCWSKYLSSCTHGYSRLAIKVVLGVTYFHNGYKILVYVVD
jgi:hypothetical protein